jgi:hypothetical protein
MKEFIVEFKSEQDEIVREVILHERSIAIKLTGANTQGTLKLSTCQSSLRDTEESNMTRCRWTMGNTGF